MELVKFSNFLNSCGAFIIINLASINARAVGSDDDSSNSEGEFFLTSQNVIVSLSVLCTIILVVFGCTWAFWRRIIFFWRKPGTHEAPPDWFVPGSVNHDDLHTTDQSDYGRRSSVTIAPLPRLSDLGVEGRDSFELRTFRTPGILAVASTHDENNPDVQDWFQPPHVSFPRANLEYQKLVGKGWFGKVLEAEALAIRPYVRASNVVVRELRNNATEEEMKRFLNEARMFREAKVSEGSVLKLMGFCVDQLPYILVFEYFPLGDLKSYLKGRARQAPSELKPGDDGVLTRMIIDVIRGVKWMEQACFVHGDLAARNCLVATPAGKVVLGDYGYSVQKHKGDYLWTAGQAIPIRWAAPETVSFRDDDESQIEMSQITHSANIWSLGVIIWEIYQLGKTPYENLTDDEVIRKVMKQKSYILEPPTLPFVKVTTKDKIYQVLVACWNSTPAHRPAIDTIEAVFTTPV